MLQPVGPPLVSPGQATGSVGHVTSWKPVLEEVRDRAPVSAALCLLVQELVAGHLVRQFVAGVRELK